MSFSALVGVGSHFGELELGGLAPAVVSVVAEVVDELGSELEVAHFEELFPADAFGPVAKAFVLVGVGGVHVKDVLHGSAQGRPAGSFVFDVGNDDLGELGTADTVGDLAADHDEAAVAFAIGDGESGAHGVAVTAVHAAFALNGNGVHLLAIEFFLGGTHGGHGAGGDSKGMATAGLVLGIIGIVLGAIYGSVKKYRDHKAEKAASEQIKQVALDWYQEQLDRDVGYVKTGHDDIIVGSITNGQPDIEWEFLDENAWKGIPDKTALSKALRENITDEKEGGFKIFIKDDLVEKVKYSRHMVFGPFLSIGITTAWLIGDVIVNWYMGLI